MHPSDQDVETALKLCVKGSVISCVQPIAEVLHRRKLCYEPQPDADHGNWIAELTEEGCAKRRRLLMPGRSHSLFNMRMARPPTPCSHPRTLITQACTDALDAARVVVGDEDLTPEQASLAIEVAEGVVDFLEARTQRILICPHGNHSIAKGKIKNGVCPRHGDVLLLAVLYAPRLPHS